MKYIKKFDTHAEYEAAESNLILPNVSFCVDTPNEVHYNPYVPPTPVEMRVVAKFNVTDTSSPTKILNQYLTTSFTSVEIDGVEQPSIITGYTFDTLGEHTVEYTIADPTKSLNYGVFDECRSLTSIEIPSGVTTIGNGVFSYCSNLTSVTIPDSVTSIGNLTFDYCRSLTSIEIPSGVTSIGFKAFGDCTSLTSIEIPSGVTTIGYLSFNRCSSLSSVTVNATTPPTLIEWCDDDDYCFYPFERNASGRKIYVPASSVNTYKVATGWSRYASAIQAIP